MSGSGVEKNFETTPKKRLPSTFMQKKQSVNCKKTANDVKTNSNNVYANGHKTKTKKTKKNISLKVELNHPIVQINCKICLKFKKQPKAQLKNYE